MTMELINYRFEFYGNYPPTLLPEYGYAQEPEVEGQVIFDYRIWLRDEHNKETGETYTTSFYAPFAKKGQLVNRDDYKFLVWQWDGNKKAPTLTPSILFDQGETGKLHLYVSSGKLAFLTDTTARVDRVVMK